MSDPRIIGLLSHCQSSEHLALPVSPAEALAEAYARFKVAGTPASLEAVAAREAVLAGEAAQSSPIRSLIAQQAQHQKVDAAQEETLAELAEAEREEAEARWQQQSLCDSAAKRRRVRKVRRCDSCL